MDKKKRTNELNYENMMLALKPKFSIASTNNDIVLYCKTTSIDKSLVIQQKFFELWNKTALLRMIFGPLKVL